MEINIKRALCENAYEIFSIESKVSNNTWSLKSYKNDISNQNSYYWIANIDEEIVGYIGILKVLDEVQVTNITVDVKYRGLGVGNKLLKTSIDYSMKQNVKKLILEVRQSNIKAINLYKKFGFEILTIRKNYYTDNNENAFLMIKCIV